MGELLEAKARTDLLNRLKRAEGQLRGVQRMIEEGQPCVDIANQMAAVRKALDSTHVRLTVCYLQQEMQGSLQLDPEASNTLSGLLDEMQTLLGRGR
jgi:CsoR family transcriptional regulator, copper-sensing transcriptional repressor